MCRNRGCGPSFVEALAYRCFKWESKITLKRGNATKTYSVHAGVDTESENYSDKNKTKEVQKIGSTTGVRPRSEAMREQKPRYFLPVN